MQLQPPTRGIHPFGNLHLCCLCSLLLHFFIQINIITNTFLQTLNPKIRHDPLMSLNLWSNLIRVSKFYLYVPRRMLGYGVGVFCWPHLFSGVFVHLDSFQVPFSVHFPRQIFFHKLIGRKKKYKKGHSTMTKRDPKRWFYWTKNLLIRSG